MKAKKLYQICLVLLGLLLALTGIACLVVATLVNHDSDLKLSHESSSRTYSTQYWFSLPVIAFGGLIMLISPSLHKRKHMTAISIFLCIPLLTCALVSAVFHGTAYSHFHSIDQYRLFLEDHAYRCSDYDIGAGYECRCTKADPFGTTPDSKYLAVPCSQQMNLSSYHGALLTLSAVTFAILLNILVLCIFLLLHFFNLQLAVNSTTSGRNNEGFSHSRGTISEHPSQSSLNIHEDRPPSYDSLLTTFGLSPVEMMSHDVSLNINASNGQNREATVNRQARVRYRGQASSMFNHQIPGRAESAESLSNDVFTADEVENVERQTAVNEVDVTDTTQGPDQSNRGNAESRQVRNNLRAHDIEDRQEPQSEENGERASAQNTGNTHRAFEASGEMAYEINSSTRNFNSSAEQTSDNDARGMRNPPVRTSSSASADHSIHVRNIPGQITQVTYEDDNTAERSFRNSRSSIDHSGDIHDTEFSQHPPLVASVSSNSEDDVYFDITQNPAQSNSSVPGFDIIRVSASYIGQLDSNSANSSSARSVMSSVCEGENVANSNIQERTSENHDSSNVVDSRDLTEQITGSLNNDAAEASGTDVAIAIELENAPENNESQSGIPAQDILSESVVVNAHNSETISVSSLDIMSI